MENDTPEALGALQVDETKLIDQVHEAVRSRVEETLTALLDGHMYTRHLKRAHPYTHAG